MVGTRALKSEWPMLEAASVISRTWLSMRRVVKKTMPNPRRTSRSHSSREAQAEVPQHPQFIALRKSQIDIAAIIHADGSHAKGNVETLYPQVRRMVGRDAARPEWPSGSARRCPLQPTACVRHRAPVCRKKTESFESLFRLQPVGHFFARQFGHFFNHAVV